MKKEKEIPQIFISSHAQKRIQQRGIKQNFAILAAMYGRKSRVPGGLYQRHLTKNISQKVGDMNTDINKSEAEKATGTVVILKEIEEGNIRTIVTVLPKHRNRRA